MAGRVRVLHVLVAAFSVPASAAAPHNLILFVPDGLRAAIVDSTTAPTMARLRDEGVNFRNSHALFPTFTTANASAFATGHRLGDTGDFSNLIYSGLPMKASNGTVTPFLESDPVLREINADYQGNYLNEQSLVALAAGKYSTALIGKLGPAAMFDPTALGQESRTLIVDDTTGHEGGVIPSKRWAEAFAKAHVEMLTPVRGANGDQGNFQKAGTLVANLDQQAWFLRVALEVVLPEFKAANRPFVMVYWSRDPDGTQHYQGDSFRSITPGINGPTSLAAVKSADDALAAIEAKLKELQLDGSTNIIAVADHGFSTISKASADSPAAALSYDDVTPRELPVGFLAIDLAMALQKTNAAFRMFDPDKANSPVDWNQRRHTARGNALIGLDAHSPKLIVAANGGSDLVYIPDSLDKGEARALARQVVDTLLGMDYVSGLFVDEDRFGRVPGALSTRAIGLAGSAVTPHPAIVVNFRSFSSDCGRVPVLCAVEIADYGLQTGQGMHGSFSRADTWNFMAARGPDFRSAYVDPLPSSNADIGMTMARLLSLDLHPKGKLKGRVLAEVLNGWSGQVPKAHVQTRSSEPAANGLRTVLKTQSAFGIVYLDAGGFPGRTVGLE
jgi:Type I phosphodiesterase / nucleotide pyrophosphatase